MCVCVEWPGLKPATSRLQVRCTNHYATMPHIMRIAIAFFTNTHIICVFVWKGILTELSLCCSIV